MEQWVMGYLKVDDSLVARPHPKPQPVTETGSHHTTRRE